MAKKHKPEEIVAKLRQVDVLTSQGTAIADAIRSIGVTEVTYYRWRNEYGGLKSDQVKRLKDLERKLIGARAAFGIGGLASSDHLQGLSPIDDVRATSSYRRDAVLSLVRRALHACVGST